MRLVCPNCAAQYDVDDAVIPEAGRDVQCSNCGHGWFQQPAGAEDGRSAAARIAGQPGPRRDAPRGDTDPSEAPPAAAPAPERQGRRALDAAVMDVLREEAEREKAARAAEAPPPPAAPEVTRIAPLPEAAAPEPAPPPETGSETEGPAEPEARPAPQPPAPDERQVASETHKARMRGENPAAALAALSGRAAQRSEMLPDIEEINSTLRASSDPSRTAEEAGDTAEAQKREARRGFRTGFGLVTIAALCATLLYTQGPRLAEAMPGVAGPIASYVAAVNKGRRWLDDTLRGAGSE